MTFALLVFLVLLSGAVGWGLGALFLLAFVHVLAHAADRWTLPRAEPGGD